MNRTRNAQWSPWAGLRSRRAIVQAGSLRLYFLLALGLLLACGSPDSTVAPTATPTQPASPGATATPAEGSGQIVTLADDGGTITLMMGERFLLELGEEYDWTVTVADPAIVSRVVNVTVVRGAQGLYEAHMAGSTTLTAAGDPVCRRAQPPCAAPSRLFEVNIAVGE